MRPKPATSETVGRSGLLTALVACEHPERVQASADLLEYVELPDGTRGLLLQHRNSYVRTGLRNALLREALGTGTSWTGIGVSSSTAAVTENTRFLNGASAGAAANTIIKALSPAPVVSAITDGATQTATAGATFTNSDFTAGVFAIAKVGLTLALTDTDGGLVDVIGGTGGAAPYNRTFALDLSAAGAFSATLQIAVTATAV